MNQEIARLLKYGLVGVANTLITVFVYFLLRRLGTGTDAANAAGYAAGFANSFLFNKLWVFRSHGKNALREALLFSAGALLCWLLQWAVFHGLLRLATGETTAYFFGMAFYTAANYLFNKRVTFGTRKPTGTPLPSERL